MSNDFDTLLRHSVSASTKNNAQRFSHNSIQGHHHSEYAIVYSADSNQLRFSMTVGAFLDPKSPAAKYAATNVLKRPILGCGMLLGARRFLIISDMHIPYHHRDSFRFLEALDAEYDFHEILCTGDMLDHHRGSYHESEPEAMGEEEEYYAAKKAVNELQCIFPKMTIVVGNHDEIPRRKLKTAGLPSSMLSDYNTLYGLSKNGWKWVDEYKFDSKGSLPMLQPMTLKSNHRWNGKIIKA
jgi:predicted phosphodiesterase